MTLFFPNLFGVSKSTSTISKAYCNIAINTSVHKTTGATSTVKPEVLNRTTSVKHLPQIVVSTATETDSVPESYAICTQTNDLQLHERGTHEERTLPFIRESAEVLEKPQIFHKSTSTLAVDNQLVEHVDCSPLSNTPSYQDNKHLVSGKSTSIFARLYDKFANRSTNVNVWHSASDSVIWNKSMSPVMVDRALSNISVSSSQPFKTAVQSFVVNRDTQTVDEELDKPVKTESKGNLEEEEMDVSLAWEILENAVKMTSSNEMVTSNRYAKLHTIEEESESHCDARKDSSIPSMMSLIRDSLSTNLTPTRAQSAEILFETKQITKSLKRSYSDGQIKSGHSFVVDIIPTLPEADKISFEPSEMSDFPTIKTDDFKLQKLQHSKPQNDGLKNNVINCAEPCLIPAGGLLICKDLSTESLVLDDDDKLNASSADDTLTNLSDLSESTATLTISTDTVDALLTESISDIFNDGEKILTCSIVKH